MQSNYYMHGRNPHALLLSSSCVFVVLMYIRAFVMVFYVRASNVLCSDVVQCYRHCYMLTDVDIFLSLAVLLHGYVLLRPVTAQWAHSACNRGSNVTE